MNWNRDAMTNDRQDTWDQNKDITKEDIQKAHDDIMRERNERPGGYGNGYDYAPTPTVEELWDRVQQDKNPYPDRG
jgi:hypothetical protein